ncbi:MAG: hypothetical protein AABW54_04465 [Candidatus Micrarchaeota archaeon]
MRRGFPLLAAAVFAISLFQPFAYAAAWQEETIYLADAPAASKPTAAAPEPTTFTVGSCTVTSFDDAEGKRFLDAVYGFTGKEITEKSDAQIRTATPADASTVINNNVYNFPADENGYFMTVREFAQLSGIAEKDIIEELGLGGGAGTAEDGTPLPAKDPADEMITVSQARAVAQKRPEGGDVMAKLRSWMASKGKSKDLVQVPGFETMKVRLPNQKEIALQDIYHYQSLRNAEGTGKSCLLDNTAINGKVTYLGMLDANLLLAADQAPKSLEHNQHLSTQTLRASVTNYDGNIVIPSFYEKAVAALSFWTQLDLMISAVSTVYAFNSVNRLKKEIEDSSKKLDRLEKMKIAPPPISGNDKGMTELAALVEQEKSADITTATSARESIAEIMANRKKVGELQKELLAPSTIAERKTEINTELAVLNGDERTRALVEIDRRNLAISEDMGKLSDEMTTNEETVRELGKLYTLAERRTWKSFVMGVAWLGPARLALELANQITFSASTPPAADKQQALEIYANTKVADTFRKSSNYFFIGSMIEGISDITKTGVPSKIFNSGPMLLLQSPGEAGKEKYSTTGLSTTPDGNWLVSTSWEGNSQVTAFEDIHDARKVTSLAVRSVYLTIGGTLQRKDEYQKYYGMIFLVAPLLTWKILPATADAIKPVATIIQLMLTQFYINNFIDPSDFDQNAQCSQEKLDRYLLWYKGMVAATIVEQFAITAAVPGAAAAGGATGVLAAINAIVNRAGSLREAITESQIIKLSQARWKAVTFVADPLEAAKAVLGSRVIAYASACKDSEYKVLAYQKLETNVPAASLKKLQAKTNDPLGISKIASSLGIGQAFAGVGEKVDTSDLKEILNVKALLSEQKGTITPSELYYLHLDPDSANMQWFNVFEENACFRECLDAGDKFVCRDKTGAYIVDKKTGAKTYVANPEQAMMGDFIPGLGMVIPNKIISTQLYCPGAAVMKINGDGKLEILNDACPAMACSMAALTKVSGTNPGRTLSNVLGNVEAIYTTQARGAPSGGVVTMFRTTGTIDTRGALGSAATYGDKYSPTSQAEATGIGKVADVASTVVTGKDISLAGREYRVPSLEVFGNPAVRASGSDKPEDQFGELRTIQLENGVVHYNPVTRKLYIALKKLSEVPAHGIESINNQPGTTSVSKESLKAEYKLVQELLARLQAGQQLSERQLEILRKALERPTATGGGLTAKEQALLQAAIAKQNSGGALNAQEQQLLEKARQAEKYPGVVVFSPQQALTVERALKADEKVDGAKATEISGKLNSGTPLTTEEKQTASAALDKAIAAAGGQPAEVNVVAKGDRIEINDKLDKNIPLTTAQKAQVTEALSNAAKLGEVTPAQASTISGKLYDGSALTPAEVASVRQAVETKTTAAGANTAAAEAVEAKRSLEKAVAPTQNADEVISKIESGGDLTRSQRNAAVNAVQAERSRVEDQLANAPAAAVPGIKLDNAGAKAGSEDNARDLNKALGQVGTLTNFRTDNKDVAFTTNERGEPVVKITERATGKMDELKITGEATRDGSAISYPTAQGPVKVEVSVNKDSGQPIFNLNAPNNIQEKAPLILAQGPQGLLYYDPQTGSWRVQNGLAVPTDPSFGTKGASFFGTQNGVSGVPDSDRFGLQRELAAAPSGYGALLSLPSWPENAAAGAALLAIILCGVAIVRRREIAA